MSACAGDSVRKPDPTGTGFGLLGDRGGDVTADLPQFGDLSVVIQAEPAPTMISTGWCLSLGLLRVLGRKTDDALSAADDVLKRLRHSAAAAVDAGLGVLGRAEHWKGRVYRSVYHQKRPNPLFL